MRRPRQYQCLCLLLLVLTSQLILTVHIQAHQDSEVVTCQLCTGYHSSSHAIVKQAMPAVVRSGEVAIATSMPVAITASFLYSFRQRAPPTST